MKLLVKEIIKETEETITIVFKNGSFFRKLKYKAGQFLTIHTVIEGVVYKRAYSFSSNPYTDSDLKITVKRVKNGLVSNYLHDQLAVGDSLKVDPAAGSFCVVPSKKEEKQYVLFAGGSGVTPIISIVKSVLTEAPKSKILMVYANQSVEAIIFHKEIQRLEAKYPNRFTVGYIIAENTMDNSNYFSGLLTNKIINTLFKNQGLTFLDHQYMICGPSGYMEKVKQVLADNSITRDKIKVEVFKQAEVKVKGGDLESQITLNFKGNSHVLKLKGDTSILVQAMSENIALPYSCRSGMCSTCKAKCVEGEVKMIDGHFLTDSEVQNGAILTCISYPVSEKITVEF